MNPEIQPPLQGQPQLNEAENVINNQLPSNTSQQVLQSPVPIQQPPNSVIPMPEPPIIPSNPSSINDRNIIFDGVETNLISFLMKKWWIVLPGIILSIGLTALLVSAGGNPLYGFIPVVLVISYLKAIYENNLFSAFAKVNNYDYQRKGGLTNQTGQVFTLGHSQRYSDIVSGPYYSWMFLLFMYEYTIGYGRYSQTYQRAIMSVNFNIPLPSFVLRRHKVFQMLEEEGESLNRSGYTQKVNLEGDFNDHFEVYIKPNTQDEALSILTPDVMETLVGLDKYEIEMTSSGTFYIYSHGYLTKKQELIDVYNILSGVTNTIGRYAHLQSELLHPPLNS